MFGGCKSKDLTSGNNSANSRVKEFKIVFFQKCVVQSMENAAVKEAFSRDLSYSHDFSLGIENYQLLDSLAEVVALEVERDSINWQQELRPISQEEFNVCMKTEL